MRCRHEALRISPKDKNVSVRDLGSGEEYLEGYDKLVIATGAAPIVPDVPGADADGLFFLKTISDMDQIIAYKNAHEPETATVIGGGFIGLEAAEALNGLGLEVTVVEAADQLLAAWDPDQVAALKEIRRKAHDNGVTDVERLTAEEIYAREPRLGPGILGGISVPGESIICPFTTNIALATQAVINGVSLFLNFDVENNDS